MSIRVKVNGTWRLVANAHPPKLGDAYEGGIYIGNFKDKFHIIASKPKYHVNSSTKQNSLGSTFLPWATTATRSTSVGTTDEDDGVVNTSILKYWINQTSNLLTNFPAFNYIETKMNTPNIEGFNDWYLPSIEELMFILKQGHGFELFDTIAPLGFLDYWTGYWASTQYSSTSAWDSPYLYEYYYRRYWYYNFYYYYNYYSYIQSGSTGIKTRNQGIIPIRRVDTIQ